uniref:RNA polymerase Rpb6 n=1 Tax=Capra hircus TaxID=9925 RepID=A0A8C2Y427_CAPHI
MVTKTNCSAHVPISRPACLPEVITARSRRRRRVLLASREAEVFCSPVSARVCVAEPGGCCAGVMSDNEDNFDGDDFDDVEEDEGLDDLENAEEEGQENVEILPSGERPQANQKRITTPYMTKYERARVLGTRALQIASCPGKQEAAERSPISDFLPAAGRNGGHLEEGCFEKRGVGNRLERKAGDVRPCDGGAGGGDRSFTDRHEGAQGPEDPHHHSPLPARRELRRLGRRRAHHHRLSWSQPLDWASTRGSSHSLFIVFIRVNSKFFNLSTPSASCCL